MLGYVHLGQDFAPIHIAFPFPRTTDLPDCDTIPPTDFLLASFLIVYHRPTFGSPTTGTRQP